MPDPMRLRRRPSSGFTLIELVVVIVILGVLAATAISKFMDMRVDARRASLQTLAGQIKSAAGNARGACMLAVNTCDIKGCFNCPRPDGTGWGLYAFISNTKISFLRGWPSPFDYYDALAIDAMVMTSGFTVVKASGFPLVFKLDGATDPENCKVIYGLEWTYSDSPPPVTIVDSGC